jgi:hypothetical protein
VCVCMCVWKGTPQTPAHPPSSGSSSRGLSCAPLEVTLVLHKGAETAGLVAAARHPGPCCFQSRDGQEVCPVLGSSEEQITVSNKYHQNCIAVHLAEAPPGMRQFLAGCGLLV